MEDAFLCNFLFLLQCEKEGDARKGSWLMLCDLALFIKDEVDPIEWKMLSLDSFSTLALVKKMLGL